MYRIGFDVGGTFTDFVLQDQQTGEIKTFKVPTTPKDPAMAVLSGLQRLLAENGVSMKDVAQAVHASTLGTNTVIERKGTNTALLTTRGFRDVLHIQRQLRFNIYDLFLDKPKAILARRWIREVTERIAYDGSVLTPLAEEEARQVVRQLASLGVTSFAVCLLHSYVNSAHEQRLGKIIAEEAPGTYITLSSAVSPQWREYERTNTAVVNAYIMPVVRGYLEKLSKELTAGGYTGSLYVMQATGGIAAAETMALEPVRMLESGPAAGALMAAFYGRLIGEPDLISFDMGGTTAKMCLIEKGEPGIANEFEIDKTKILKGSGLAINVPSIDLIEIGAGGGSTAEVALGTIKVGPESSGADPGPICYGLGGREPTVTDADLVLGYLNPDYFLGGRMRLGLEGARRGIEDKIAKPLGISVAEAAWGIHEIVNQNMMRATRVVSVERGRDPRRFAFIAFGGAGPVHGCRLARGLGIPKAILPAAAGVTSALGLLVADVKFDFARTHVVHLNDQNLSPINALYREMEALGRQALQQSGAEGQSTLVRSADMHYVGQGYEVSVPIPSTVLSSTDVPTLKEAFHTVYARLFGYSDREAEIQVNSWKLSASCSAPRASLPRYDGGSGDPRTALKGNRKAYFPESGGFIGCDVYDRYLLQPGSTLRGPAIVEERESTTVVLPGDEARVDEYANLVVTIKQ